LVLFALREHDLYANVHKSEFDLTELEYVRHIVSFEGLKVHPKKVASFE
jgi:hypothetical protein